MTHARDRANPEKTSNAPGTFFSQIDVTFPLSDRITKPMIIKITAITDSKIKTVVDNILKRLWLCEN